MCRLSVRLLCCDLCPEREEAAAGQTPGSGCSQNQTKESQDGWCKSCGKETHTHTHALIEQLKWILLLVHSLANFFAGEENLSGVSQCHSVWSHTSTAWHTMLHNTRLTILFLVTCKESHEPPWEVLEFPFLNLISCFVFVFFRQTVETLD